MRSVIKSLAGAGIVGLAMTASARASNVLVTSDITVSTTWTANNTYDLQTQIYVRPGATLTIDPGTIVASDTGVGGSLCICRGAQIFVNGTEQSPVIMTSTSDVATWTAGNPKTGVWRAVCNEWGNLTIEGQAYISANNHGGATTNVPTFNANNVAPMEGLVAQFPGDPDVLYGGGNDDDDSGSVTYLSLRYGGKVVALNNELNGLSMGGIGRGTTVHHIDIMNNIDDGIETWGGTVNYKYLNIWNIGDDSFDLDEGWRGKAQFGLLVCGYSRVADVGSGVGDHSFEMDGAEDSDWQPVSTNVFYNFTAIHQPNTLRGLAAFRDNDRSQFHNCIFMDSGGQVVKFDNSDGDGAHGYGFNGTLDWPTTWTTPYNVVPPTANDPVGPRSTYYPAQVSGNLIEFTDSVFFRNQAANTYTEANARGVFAAGNNNVNVGSIADADAPIQSIQRDPVGVMATGSNAYLVQNVISLDPRPKNAALVSVGQAPNDGFYTPAQYRGAFAPNAKSWLCDWTASFAFGFTTDCSPGVAFCAPGVGGIVTCPCGNPQVPAGSTRGCNNFAGGGTGGALLGCSGTAVTNAGDTLGFQLTAGVASNVTVLFQGTTNTANSRTGAGVKCVAGTLKRIYKGNQAAGAINFPNNGVPVHLQSAAKGFPIVAPVTLYYYAAYRNSAANGQPGCPGLTFGFNSTNAQAVTWSP